MKRSATTLVMVLASLSVSLWAAEPIYVGGAVCRSCHPGQYAPWYGSKHALAFASLARPESAEIVRLSGIDVDPFRSPVCLGCHATAADVEGWERDVSFHIEDGVQCELCHGPGSEYIAVMNDPEQASKAGLRMPDGSLCMVCHKDKGSHMAALEVRHFDLPQALQVIAHPGPSVPPPPESAPPAEAELIGALACAPCHQGPKGGFVFSRWRLSAHARAWSDLGTASAHTIAAGQGVTGDPRQDRRCLRCHSTQTQGDDPTRGVECESCHGAGSGYATEAVMLDPIAARRAGLQPVTERTCTPCHGPEAHGSTFDFGAMAPQVDHSAPAGGDSQATPTYKTPFNLAVSDDGATLLIACEASDSLIVVDTASRRVTAEVAVEKLPHGVCLSPDQSRAFVSNRGSDSVSVVDLASKRVVATIAVGDEPHGLVTDRAGAMLYVANAGSYDISVVDLAASREVKRLAAGRGAWDVARSPDGASVLVTNNLSHFVPFRASSRSEVTVVGSLRSRVSNRIMIPDANLVQGVDWAPDGRFAVVTLIRTKNLIPMTRVIQGWVITNGIGVVWPDGRVDQVLLDEPDSFFADPTDIAITPDGRLAFVSGGGVNEVAVVDLARLETILSRASAQERAELIPNHLGVPTEIVIARIPVGANPRGVVASRDGRFVYVADALDDAVSVIDVARRERLATIDLGGPGELSLARRGERIFHSAEVTYGRQFSCHSCHPDGGIDGITYDIEPDGIGINPVDNRSLRGVLDTAPFKWTGKNPSLARQCGPRLAVFFTRIDPFTPEQVKALERYICTIPRNPNRYRGIDEPLTPAQRRGRKVFERAVTNTGEPIPVANRCITCHAPPYFTNREKAYVGPGSWLDTHNVFDVPHLTNIYETAPYLHDGRADTLEEIWTRFNPRDEHGVTNDMTKDQLNDLVEYLKTL